MNMLISLTKRVFVLLTFVTLLMTGLELNAFEGVIHFQRYTTYDTSLLKYSIQNNKVRINKYDKDGQVIECLLVDVKKEKVFALDPQKALYRPLQLDDREEGSGNDKYKIIRRGNHKKINGVTCYQWRVRDRESNSEIAYWVTKKNFDFFHKLIDLLERTNKIYHFFAEIPGNKHMFPLLSVERTLLRDERQRLAVTEIIRKPMDKQLFTIPDSYRMVSR
jgi:hypothetical protein